MKHASGASAAPQTTKHAMGYFRGIDGLRALAVLAVIIFHLNEQGGLRGGLVGVDVFFVISGFVVTASVSGRNFRSFWSFLGFFYIRRIRRIYPALSVCLVTIFLAYALFIPNSWLSDFIPATGRAAFIGFSNVVLALRSDDYFSPQATFNPFTHTWSLGVEEQFYLVFPFLMFAYQRASHSAVWKTRLIALISLCCLVSLAICAFATPHHFRFAFYMLPSRFWELGVGMLLCLTSERWVAWLRGHEMRGKLISLLSLALIFLAFFLPVDTGFPWPLAIIPVAATAGLIAAIVAEAKTPVVSGFSHAVPVYFGKRSYSLYLWHWPVFVLMRWTWGLNTPVDWAIGLTLTLILAAASYRLVERPLRYQGRESRAKTALLFSTSLVIGVACYFAASALTDNKNAISLSTTRNAALWYPESDEAFQPGLSCHLTRVHRRFSGVTENIISPVGCPASAGRLFVAGDSHAAAYAAMLYRFARETGTELHFYSYAGCSYANLSRPAKGDCLAGQTAVNKDLAQNMTPKDVLFLPSLRLDRFADQWGAVHNPAPTPQDRDIALRDAKSIIESVHGARVVFEVPTPIFRSAPFRCSDWFDRHNPDCAGGFALSRSEFERLQRPVVDQMHRLESQFPNVSAWDPNPVLCEKDYCHAVRDGAPLFFDGDHLSGHANAILLPSFKKYFAPLVSPANTKVSQ